MGNAWKSLRWFGGIALLRKEEIEIMNKPKNWKSPTKNCLSHLTLEQCEEFEAKWEAADYKGKDALKQEYGFCNTQICHLLQKWSYRGVYAGGVKHPKQIAYEEGNAANAAALDRRAKLEAEKKRKQKA